MSRGRLRFFFKSAIRVPCGTVRALHKSPTQVSGPNGEWDLDLHGTWQKPVPKYTRGGAGIFVLSSVFRPPCGFYVYCTWHLHKPHSGLWCDLVSRSRCVLCMDNKCMPSFVVSHSYINVVPIKMN